MVLAKKQKEDLVKWLVEILKKSKGVVFVQFYGLGVNDASKLRSNFRQKNIGCKVIKNTLLLRAAKDANIALDEKALENKTIALAYSAEDEVEPSKIAYNFSRENEAVKLVSGIVNREYLDENKILALAKLPGREELYAKVVGSIGAPLSRIVNVLAGNLRGLVSVLKQYQEQRAK